MTQGFQLTSLDTFDIITTYSIPQETVRGYLDVRPYVVGAFQSTQTFSTSFSITGSVSKPGISLNVQMVRLDPGGTASPVGSTVTITSEATKRAVSGSVSIEAGNIYQFQAWCTGSEDLDAFGIINAGLLEVA